MEDKNNDISLENHHCEKVLTSATRVGGVNKLIDKKNTLLNAQCEQKVIKFIWKANSVLFVQCQEQHNIYFNNV